MGLLARRKRVPGGGAARDSRRSRRARQRSAHEGEDHAAPARRDGGRARPRQTAGGRLIVRPQADATPACRSDRHHGERRSSPHDRIAGADHPGSQCERIRAGLGREGGCPRPRPGFPRLGTRVNKGDVLAYVTPPVQAVDVSDMRQRQGELDQQISIVERRIARFEPLAQKGVVTQVQLDEARLELQGLQGSAQRARPGEGRAGSAGRSGLRRHRGNQCRRRTDGAAECRSCFRSSSPTRLWVEALSFDTLDRRPDARSPRPAPGAALPLGYQGAGFADRNQAVPVHFRIEGDASGLRAGQFVTVLAATEEEKQGIAVPRASVVRSAERPGSSSSSTARPSGSSRARCASSRSMASGCWSSPG